MREVDAKAIAEEVARLSVEANYHIGSDIREAFRRAMEYERDDVPREVLRCLLENAKIADRGKLPLCQDTGMAVVFVEIGQDVHIAGSVEDAVNEGVRRGFEEGYLRKSIVADPVRRVNTKDNTPAVIHYKVTRGDRIRLVVAPKGFGSENMSALSMLTPSQGLEGVKKFVLDTVDRAGPNPCPPVVVGVGVGGTMEKAAVMAKEALLRPVGTGNEDEFWDGVERALLASINGLDIGPAGFGGVTTALAVHIRTYPTHIAGLPVAVNIGCHATRHAEAVI